MISALGVKQIFVALRLHFTSDYDYFRYNGKTKVSSIKPNEVFFKSLAARLRREERVLKFFISNFTKSFSENTRIESWIGNYKAREAFDAINDYDDEFACITYTINQLLNEYSIKELVDKDTNLLYKLYLRKRISLIHLGVLYKALKLDKYWDWSKDPLMEETNKFLKKLCPFLQIDEVRIRDVIFNHK